MKPIRIVQLFVLVAVLASAWASYLAIGLWRDMAAEDDGYGPAPRGQAEECAEDSLTVKWNRDEDDRPVSSYLSRECLKWEPIR